MVNPYSKTHIAFPKATNERLTHTNGRKSRWTQTLALLFESELRSTHLIAAPHFLRTCVVAIRHQSIREADIPQPIGDHTARAGIIAHVL